MRKITLFTLILIIIGAGIGYIYLGQPLNPERRYLQKMSMKFMEDLQFKDFRASSLYHHKLERNRVDIGRALEQLFVIKPELLDILDFRVARMEVDSSGNRAKTLMRTRMRRLNQTDDVEEADIMLYWIKRHPECPMGARCLQGQCFDEYGERLYKPRDESANRSKREIEFRDAPEVEDSEDIYSCSDDAQAQWFMNLDSTLKEKRYNQ